MYRYILANEIFLPTENGFPQLDNDKTTITKEEYNTMIHQSGKNSMNIHMFKVVF